MSDRANMFDLKEKAKWSHDLAEKKAAIKELSTKGLNAIPQLEEILNISAYEDIKIACAEAIRAIRVSNKEGDERTTTSDFNQAPTSSMMATKNQKKEEKEGESAAEGEIRLADLPP